VTIGRWWEHTALNAETESFDGLRMSAHGSAHGEVEIGGGDGRMPDQIGVQAQGRGGALNDSDNSDSASARITNATLP
jgi:hypothetical protein